MADAPESNEAATASHATARRGGVTRTAWLASVVVAALVAGAAGGAIGWTVQKQRVDDDLANVRPIGRVTAVSDDEVAVTLLTSDGTRTYEITDDTAVSGDVAEDAVVLVRSRRGGDDQLQATEIIVLPDTSTFAGREG